MIVATTGGTTLWYLTRGTGIVALVLLTASMALGIMEVNRWASPRWPRFVTAGLHRNLSLLSVAFVGVHVATTILDGFAPIGWLDAVIPFRSPYRPLWLGLGTVAVDLLLALVVTSLLRARLGYRVWKAVHWAAYACWPVALVHGLGTGTDIRRGWALAVNLLSLVAVVVAVWWRLVNARRERSERRGADAVWAGRFWVPAAVSSVVVPLAIVAWLMVGPLQPGWARRAGTPPRLRGAAVATSGGVAAAAGAGAATSAAPGLAGAGFSLPDSATFQGRISRTAGVAGQRTDTIRATLAGPTPADLVIVLNGAPRAEGGLVLTSSRVSVGPGTDPGEYQGTVTSLQGSTLVAGLTGPDGQHLVAAVRLAISDDGTLSGSLRQESANG